MSQLYQELILDHFKNPRNKGLAEAFAYEGRANNPVCGDTASARLSEGPDGLTMTHEVDGCAISQAAASVLAELIEGAKPEEVPALLDRFAAVVAGKDSGEGMSDAAAFAGIAKFPARAYCALLPVRALRQALGIDSAQ